LPRRIRCAGGVSAGRGQALSARSLAAAASIPGGGRGVWTIAASADRLARPQLGAPGGAWAAVLVALLTAAAFWRSVLSLAPLLGVEQAAGLTPALPLLAVWLAAATVRARARAGRPQVGVREGALDGPAAAVMLGIAGWLLWRAPVEDGWYFWAHRLDLLAAALFALGIAVLLWGVQTLIWHRLAVLYALLLWPEPLVRLQELVAEPLALLTALLARPLAVAAGVRLANELGTAGDPTVFISAGPSRWTIVVGDVCSGLNAGLAVALVCLPAAAWLRLPLRRALPWIGVGISLALLSNLLRVVALLFTADRYGTAVAMGTVHPVLGAVLLAGVFGVLWWLAPVPAEPAAPAAPAGSHTPVAAGGSRPVSWRLVGGAAVAAAAFAVGSGRLAVFEPLPPIGPPGGSVNEPLDYLRLPLEWTIEDQGVLTWQHLFGRDSHSYAVNLRSTAGALVKAQVVVTADRSRLQAFGLQACRDYHGDDVVGQRTVELGAGGVASLVDTWDRGRPESTGRLSVIHWHAPFLLEGRPMHVRVALFAGQEEASGYALPSQTGLAPGGIAFDRADSTLVDLARAITREVLQATDHSA
jgi:exosortase/archaeosortase family protein